MAVVSDVAPVELSANCRTPGAGAVGMELDELLTAIVMAFQPTADEVDWKIPAPHTSQSPGASGKVTKLVTVPVVTNATAEDVAIDAVVYSPTTPDAAAVPVVLPVMNETPGLGYVPDRLPPAGVPLKLRLLVPAGSA